MSKYKYEGYGVVRDTEIDFPYHTDDIVDLLDEKDQQITDLETKLAESEKERELDNSFWKQECDSLQKTLVEKDKEIENLTEELDDKNFCRDFVDLYTENRLKTQLLNENWKDKISFTIQQLEKARKLIDELLDNCGDKQYKVWEVFDNQIRQLKEKNNG